MRADATESLLRWRSIHLCATPAYPMLANLLVVEDSTVALSSQQTALRPYSWVLTSTDTHSFLFSPHV